MNASTAAALEVLDRDLDQASRNVRHWLDVRAQRPLREDERAAFEWSAGREQGLSDAIAVLRRIGMIA